MYLEILYLGPGKVRVVGVNPAADTFRGRRVWLV